MDDHYLTVPDSVPQFLQDDYVAQARQQVEASRCTGQPAPVAAVPAARPAAPGHRRRRGSGAARSTVASKPSPGATAATVLGLLGFIPVTGMWSWLAVTDDPMWWWFTGIGVAMIVGLVVAGVLQILMRTRASRRAASRSA